MNNQSYLSLPEAANHSLEVRIVLPWLCVTSSYFPHKSASSQNTPRTRTWNSWQKQVRLAPLGNATSGSQRPKLHPFSLNSIDFLIFRGMKVRKLIIPDLTRSAPRYICPECRYFSNITRTSRWRPVMLGQQKLGSKTWHRGAKRTTTLKVKTVPQGSLPAKPVENVDESDGPVYPTVLQQVRNNMQKFSHCVVLTRVGNFYEVTIHTL